MLARRRALSIHGGFFRFRRRLSTFSSPATESFSLTAVCPGWREAPSVVIVPRLSAARPVSPPVAVASVSPTAAVSGRSNGAGSHTWFVTNVRVSSFALIGSRRGGGRFWTGSRQASRAAASASASRLFRFRFFLCDDDDDDDDDATDGLAASSSTRTVAPPVGRAVSGLRRVESSAEPRPESLLVLSSLQHGDARSALWTPRRRGDATPRAASSSSNASSCVAASGPEMASTSVTSPPSES